MRNLLLIYAKMINILVQNGVYIILLNTGYSKTQSVSVIYDVFYISGLQKLK